MSDFIVVTCEHGGNQVPAAFHALFANHRALLNSHRGYDPGSLELARTCARRLDAPLHYSTVTRLLVELNRSLGHPALFSVATRPLSQAQRQALLQKHYFPYRNAVEAEIEKAVTRNRRVLHLSMHTFTPELDGVTRRADVGLLYDPARLGEGALCRLLQASLQARRSDLIVRRNYPYLGASDGFTTALRKQWPSATYLGIEIEVNQRWPTGDRQQWRQLQRDLSGTIADCLREFSANVSRRAIISPLSHRVEDPPRWKRGRG